MTAAGRAALWLGGLVVGAVVLERALFPPPRPPARNPPNPWITLKKRLRRTGRRQRVFIDDDGRIRRGLPEKFHGINIGDLTQVGQAVRRQKKQAARARRQLARRMPETFRSKDTALRELLAANPKLDDFLQREWGNGSQAYKAWRRRGRRGPKPRLQAFDGRFDALNGAWDLEGPRAVGSWLEALYETIPASGRWDDFADRLPVLEEATGLRLQLPAPAERRELSRGELEQFDEGDELEEEGIYRQARMAAGGADLEEAPF
jgi:hypothetical protein